MYSVHVNIDLLDDLMSLKRNGYILWLQKHVAYNFIAATVF